MSEYTTKKITRRFELLRQYERRCIVRFLQETEANCVSIDTLATHPQTQEPTATERNKLRLSLHHAHLPKLATLDTFAVDFCLETVRYDGDELLGALLEPIPCSPSS